MLHGVSLTFEPYPKAVISTSLTSDLTVAVASEPPISAGRENNVVQQIRRLRPRLRRQQDPPKRLLVFRC